ncbi:hypothetical protein NDU88_003617 [Pleurodeles waltl]|uniref:Uncharacterized protein n=1 Tax=Pleurodeles waltl TaxID=8319 RepID=A0AAV7QA79_PLEWA|nr:hypothetical protein NDU88_003617 [Pleurodeles waltl]
MAENYSGHRTVDSFHNRESTPYSKQETSAGGAARSMVARVLKYRDRDTLLRVAREADLIMMDNVRVSLYPDYTLAVQRQRASFQALNKRLRAEGISYPLLFLARLCITDNQKVNFF